MKDEYSTFALIPPHNLLNLLPSGALQEIKGIIHPNGIWTIFAVDYYIYLPFNNKGTVIQKVINSELATAINWNKVNEVVLDAWEKNKISSADIEHLDIMDILALLEIKNKNNFSIKNEFQMFYRYEPETMNIIDITDKANPKREKK